MALVDPEDDELDRWVVYHFRFDPVRHERRNVAVAAYDNCAEMEQHVAEATIELGVLQEQELADQREHYFGTPMHPGSRSQAQARRLERESFLRKSSGT